jgi:hypothetical protein
MCSPKQSQQNHKVHAIQAHAYNSTLLGSPANVLAVLCRKMLENKCLHRYELKKDLHHCIKNQHLQLHKRRQRKQVRWKSNQWILVKVPAHRMPSALAQVTSHLITYRYCSIVSPLNAPASMLVITFLYKSLHPHIASARIHPCSTHTYSVLRLARSVNSPAWMKSIWLPSKALSHIRRMRSVLCTTPSLQAHVQVQKRRQSRKHSVSDARDLVRSQRPVQHRTSNHTYLAVPLSLQTPSAYTSNSVLSPPNMRAGSVLMLFEVRCLCSHMLTPQAAI